MNNKVTVAVGYNPNTNRFWVASKIIELVKAGTADIYIINSDQKIAGDVLETVREMVKDDADYQRHVHMHNIQIHPMNPEDIDELDDVVKTGPGAILVNSVFSLPLRALTALRKHDMPVFIGAAPSQLTGVDNEDIDYRYL
ncbi:hypothetical protein pEaSNUABM37_00235 [Erwinia phage pEa_SNUABM_37]|nr:hypothetical protein pEaSNUABM37_00235 [Erwinia phage pEa_SNUABM_37]QXO10703.1 hypothetical protein pEaSNUABM48_00235 [Erwinia phage pEa_SNUABM_48]